MNVRIIPRTPYRGVENFILSPSMVDPKDNEVKIINNSGSNVTVVSPMSYTIGGQQSAIIQNGQYITLQLVNFLFTIVDGNVLAITEITNNTIPTGLIIGGVKTFTVTQDLQKGDNEIVHNLKATPRQVSFQQNGTSIGVGYSISFYGNPKNILNANVTRAEPQVSINIVAYD